MFRVMQNLFFCLVVCAMFLCASCSNPEDGKKEGCIAAYNASYRCWGYTYASNALEKASDEIADCSEFAKNLEEGLHWIQRVNIAGDTLTSMEAVGENGWLALGNRVISYGKGEAFVEEGACRLDSVTADSVLMGACVTYNTLSISATDGAFIDCLENKCDFSVPVRWENIVDDRDNLVCISRRHANQEILDSIEVNPSAYQVFVSEDEISVKILETTVTWTKRPGL